jgi:membrane-associated HD superfamily phosphohydrolase
MTNGKQQSPNSNFQASSGKTGVNWMSTGTILAPGEFIGSNDGSIYLTMQTNGNLTLNTSSPQTNCSKMSNGYYGGGVGANPIYQLSETGDSSLLNNIYYIDQNSTAYLYPSQNITSSNNYTKFPNVNTSGNDLGPLYNSTVSECQQTCDNNNSCAGFVFDDYNNICWPKNNNMWPYSNDFQYDPNNVEWNADTYLKMNQLSSTPLGVETNTINIDSATAKNYINSNTNMALSYGSIKEISQQLLELNDLENQIENLANQLTNNNIQIETSQNEVYKQTVKDRKAVEKFLKDYKIIEKKIKTMDTNINILKDTDILVLQENYYYYLWTILAIGIVIFGINILKNK